MLYLTWLYNLVKESLTNEMIDVVKNSTAIMSHLLPIYSFEIFERLKIAFIISGVDIQQGRRSLHQLLTIFVSV